MDSLRLGIVGCGDIAGFTALVSRLVPALRLAAACDHDPDRVASFARRHGIRATYTNYDEMLGSGNVDAVYLALPHDLHLPMACAAIAAGLPVLVEKPLARNLPEGRRLVAASEAANVKVGVNYQYRYDRACHALHGLLAEGTLGTVRHARINIPWHRERKYFEASPWHRSISRAGGGTLITQGSHFLDVALWSIGKAPVSAMGYVASPGFDADIDVEVDTLAAGIVETEGGALISISSSMVAAREGRVSVEVYGERGSAVYTNKPWPRLVVWAPGLRASRAPLPGVHALQRSLAGFVGWVLTDRPYLVPASEALSVLAAVDGIYRSAASGKRELL
ncbi:MAG: Gfo/Idh/MocA family protein [Rectinemataceae bacterium]